MIETQASVCEWAEQTFGPSDIHNIIARANEEMAELMRLVVAPIPDASKIAEECADVTGVLYRAAKWADDCLDDVITVVAVKSATIYSAACRANSHIAFFLERLQISEALPKHDAARIIGSIVLKLAEICASCGTTLGAEIDRKMTINRNAREWRRDGTGNGYHVRRDFLTRAEAMYEQGYKANGEPL